MDTVVETLERIAATPLDELRDEDAALVARQVLTRAKHQTPVDVARFGSNI